MDVGQHEKRIAKNTIFLYVRILISIALSLYTSRVVLEMLGVRDYGVYNVVGGLIIILSFLNGTMSGATQRFLNFEMGRARMGRLSDTFSAAWTIHLAIAAIVLVLGETVGVWFVNNFLVIDPQRMTAANFTYQFSLFGGILTVLMVPFTGTVFAHEKMNVYAAFTLVFSFLKLGVALLLLFVAAADNLIIYAALMLGVTLVHFLCFFIYALRKFPECSLRFLATKKTIRAMLGFSGSDLIGTTCFTLQTQGVLVILNRIGGTVLNAAGGLTSTVTLTLDQFGSTLVMAFRPQIIQQYAARNFAFMQRLMINCSKYSIILMALFAIPVFIEMEYILNLWLTEVPAHTVSFCRITLLSSMSQMAINTLNCGIHATGKIFWFSTLTGLSYIITLPVMYFCTIATDNPNWVFIIPIFQLTFNIGLISFLLKKRMEAFRISRFVSKGFLAPTVITLLVAVIAYIPSLYVPHGFLQLLSVGIVSTSFLAFASWCILFDRQMRVSVIEFIKNKLNLR